MCKIVTFKDSSITVVDKFRLQESFVKVLFSRLNIAGILLCYLGLRLKSTANQYLCGLIAEILTLFVNVIKKLLKFLEHFCLELHFYHHFIL